MTTKKGGTPHRDPVDYWKNVTSGNHAHHPVPKEQVYEVCLDELRIQPGDRLLDIGTGFGRLIPAYLRRGAMVTGVDIDAAMLAEARAKTAGGRAELALADAASMPFAAESFRHAVCWGVFEELDQSAVLLEVNRVLTRDGTFLVTGKNSLYEADDEEALRAEEGARRKGHPNCFTDLPGVDFAGFGFDVDRARYFARRGDFAINRSLPLMPPRFYEYLLVLRKTAVSRYTAGAAPRITDSVSRTWCERRGTST